MAYASDYPSKDEKSMYEEGKSYGKKVRGYKDEYIMYDDSLKAVEADVNATKAANRLDSSYQEDAAGATEQPFVTPSEAAE